MMPSMAMPHEIMWHMLESHVHSGSLFVRGSSGDGHTMDVGCAQLERIAEVSSCYGCYQMLTVIRCGPLAAIVAVLLNSLGLLNGPRSQC